MRKMKFWAAMALLVFAFMSGGCGGSASSDDNSSSDSSDTATLHSQVKALLEGQWVIDSNYGYNVGSATINPVGGSAVPVVLGRPDFKVIFSNISFTDSSEESDGSGSIYYSLVSPATQTDGTSLGDFIHRSYTSSSSSKTLSMTLTRTSDLVWTCTDSSGNFRMTMTFTSLSLTRMNVSVTGSGYLSDSGAACDYSSLTCTLTRQSTSTDIEDTDTEVGDLAGTWKFSAGDDSNSEATATSTTQGTSKTLTLKIASDIEMKISNIVLSGDTQLSGTAHVVYQHYWTAYHDQDNSVIYGTPGQFYIHRDDSEADMKLIQESSGVWRLEDTKDKNQNIIIKRNQLTLHLKTISNINSNSFPTIQKTL